MKKLFNVFVIFVTLIAMLIFAVPVLASTGSHAPTATDPLSVEVTPEWLLVVGAAVLSLLMKYIPGVNTWYVAKSKEFQQGFMALLILAGTIVVFVGTCYGLVNSNLVCTAQGGVNALMIYVLALASNQGIYGVSPDPTAVQLVKNTRKTIELKTALKK